MPTLDVRRSQTAGEGELPCSTRGLSGTELEKEVKLNLLKGENLGGSNGERPANSASLPINRRSNAKERGSSAGTASPTNIEEGITASPSQSSS